MQTARQVLAYFLAALSAAAQAVATTTKMVWRGSRWVLETVAAPFAPTRAPVAGAGAADATAALAEAAQAGVGVPGKAVAPTAEPLDAALEWGKLAQRWAVAQSTLGEDPDLGLLDEAAVAWLHSLQTIELMALTNQASPRRIGEHMLGDRIMPGVPLCPTMAEYRHAQREAAQMTAEKRTRMAEGRQSIQDALDDLIASPKYVFPQGV